MARFRVDDVWALRAGRRVSVGGEILTGEVRPGMIARSASGFVAVVRAVEFARQAGGVEQLALDLGSPETPPEEQAWLDQLGAISELDIDFPDVDIPTQPPNVR